MGIEFMDIIPYLYKEFLNKNMYIWLPGADCYITFHWIQGGPKKSLWIDLAEKCLRNTKIFFDGVFLSINSHLFKKLDLSKLHRKKVIGL